MTDPERFLSRFADASRAAAPLEVIGGDPEGFSAAATLMPDDFHRALEEDASRAPGAPAILNAGAFASAACDAQGAIVCADAAFLAHAGLEQSARAELHGIGCGGAGVSFVVEDRGAFVAVAAAPFVKARDWPLAGTVRRCLERGEASIALIAFAPNARPGAATAQAAGVLGLTGLEARVASGLIRGGDARAAARLAGVSYETARDALKSAMRKAGCRRQPEFVSVFIAAESGEAPSIDVRPLLRDLFGLSDRQARIALVLAAGASRQDTARLLGLSEHVVKAELKLVFAACLADTAAALCRVIAQISALSALASAVAIDFQPAAAVERLRLLPRPGRPGRIAFVDHGGDGAPTVFLHSATTGRHLPERYVAALQALGLRPIAVDRPGYGLTNMGAQAYLDDSADDVAAVLDHVGLARAHVVCRSGAVAVARFAQRHSDRLHRAVLINPEAPARADTRFTGVLGGIKRLVQNNPDTVAALVRTLSRRAAPESIATVVRAALRHSPADLATLNDPAFMAGFVRASQQAAMQEGAGFVALERCVAEADIAPGAVPGEERFHMLLGAQDPLQASDDALRWWRAALPGAGFEHVPNAGRFLHAQRPDLIAKALHA